MYAQPASRTKEALSELHKVDEWLAWSLRPANSDIIDQAVLHIMSHAEAVYDCHLSMHCASRSNVLGGDTIGAQWTSEHPTTTDDMKAVIICKGAPSSCLNMIVTGR